MRIIIVGSSGFIGLALLENLTHDGHEVLAISRGKRSLPSLPGVTELHCELAELASRREELKRFGAEAALFQIAYSKRDAEVLLAAFLDVVARAVVISSGDVYRNFGGLLRKETAQPTDSPLSEHSNLRSAYFINASPAKPIDPEKAYEKILVEQTLLNSPLSCTVLRLPAVYGERDVLMRLWPYVKRMQDRRRFIILSTEQSKWRCTRDYVGNIASSIGRVLKRAQVPENIYNLGSPVADTESDWIRRIAAEMKWEGQLFTMENNLLPEKLRTPFDWRFNTEMDVARFARDFCGADMLPTSVAIKKTAIWQLDHPPAAAAQLEDIYRVEDSVVN